MPTTIIHNVFLFDIPKTIISPIFYWNLDMFIYPVQNIKLEWYFINLTIPNKYFSPQQLMPSNWCLHHCLFYQFSLLYITVKISDHKIFHEIQYITTCILYTKCESIQELFMDLSLPTKHMHWNISWRTVTQIFFKTILWLYPDLLTRDMTIFSLNGSMGGLVTWAKSCLK